MFVYFKTAYIKGNTLQFQIPSENNPINYSVTLYSEEGKYLVCFIIESTVGDGIKPAAIEHVIPSLGTIKTDGRKNRIRFNVESWMTMDELDKLIRSSTVSVINNGNKTFHKLDSIEIKRCYVKPISIENYHFGYFSKKTAAIYLTMHEIWGRFCQGSIGSFARKKGSSTGFLLHV